MNKPVFPTGEWLVGRAVERTDPCLRTGAQYVESLRDGRCVVLGGRDVADVTEIPQLRRGIDTLAGLFDAQFDPETREEVTSIEPKSGHRIATGWLVPRSKDDLKRHLATIRFSTLHTFGVFGRPPDYGPVKAIGFMAFNHLVKKEEPDAIRKIERFVEIGQRHNLVSADIIIDVQTSRKLPMPEQEGRLRVVEQRKDGVIVSGIKAGNSVMAQGNIGTISMPPPNPTMPDECMLWSVVPSHVEGIKNILREPATTGLEHPEDHPLDSAGEEGDGMLLFDRVFIPDEYVFSFKNKATSGAYYTLGRFAQFKIAARLSYRAEIFAGAAQAIVDALGTDHIPGVRALVADVCAYAATLRAFMVAAVERAEATESGVVLPDPVMVTACRLHSVVGLPGIMQNLRELSGQGLISRVPRATWERQDIGPLLDRYLPGYKVSAREKNRLFNLIWDMSSSGAALRIALFENLNATPAAPLREELYRTYDRSEGLAIIRKKAGLD
jgi:4-hydroxyphenylacetate 3-monooxygenase